jgi:hypothetical protein
LEKMVLSYSHLEYIPNYWRNIVDKGE